MVRNRMLLRITMKNTNGFDRKDEFNYFEENPIYQTRKFNKLGSSYYFDGISFFIVLELMYGVISSVISKMQSAEVL